MLSSELSRGVPRLWRVPVRSSPSKNAFTRLKETTVEIPQFGKAGPYYTIWGARKPVMIQFKASENITPEQIRGIALIEGPVAQIAMPSGFLPRFAFTWILDPEIIAIILPTRKEQHARYFPTDYDELVADYTVVVYNLGEHRRTMRPPRLLQDNMQQFKAAA